MYTMHIQVKSSSSKKYPAFSTSNDATAQETQIWSLHAIIKGHTPIKHFKVLHMITKVMIYSKISQQARTLCYTALTARQSFFQFCRFRNVFTSCAPLRKPACDVTVPAQYAQLRWQDVCWTKRKLSAYIRPKWPHALHIQNKRAPEFLWRLFPC